MFMYQSGQKKDDSRAVKFAFKKITESKYEASFDDPRFKKFNLKPSVIVYKKMVQ